MTSAERVTRNNAELVVEFAGGVATNGSQFSNACPLQSIHTTNTAGKDPLVAGSMPADSWAAEDEGLTIGSSYGRLIKIPNNNRRSDASGKGQQ